METAAEQRLTALIVTGGNCSAERARAALPDRPGLVIAADSGLRTARALGIVPDIVMGDFDSYTEALPEGIPVLRVPAEKDVTDTMLAADYAAEQGYRELLIVGGTGGRLDHELSNLFMLESLRRRGIRAALTDGDNTVRVLLDERADVRDEGGYFSVIAAEPSVVTITGAKYPLERARLDRSNPSLGVSNEVTEGTAEVEAEGCVFLITSRR